MLGASSFRRFGAAAGLAALLILLFVGVVEAACADCSEHDAGAVEMAMDHHAHGTEDPPPCCDPGDSDSGSVPDLPVCPLSFAATGCAGAGTLPAVPASGLNAAFPAELGSSVMTAVPISAVAAPPFRPPRA